MAFITIGKPHLGLVLSILSGTTNVILDYILITIFDMGLTGAAIATGIGYSIPALVGLIYFIINRKNTLYIAKPVFNLSAVWKSALNGASKMVGALSNGVVALLFNNILIRIAGVQGIASITIIIYVQNILSSAYRGYSFGISPLISYNYGKEDDSHLKQIYSVSLKSILIASIVTFIFSQVCASFLVGIFAQKNSEVFNMAVHGYRIYSIVFLFLGFNTFSSAMFTTLNNGKISATLSFCRTLGFIVLAALTLPFIFGVEGIWIATPFAEVMSIFMTIYYFKKMKPIYKYA